MGKGIDSDPDPNWDPDQIQIFGKFQDPDPNTTYLDLQHCSLWSIHSFTSIPCPTSLTKHFTSFRNQSIKNILSKINKTKREMVILRIFLTKTIMNIPGVSPQRSFCWQYAPPLEKMHMLNRV